MPNLTIDEIIKAFPDECKTILPREIRRLKKLKREYDLERKLIKLRGHDRFTQWFLLRVLESFTDQNKLLHLVRLERMQTLFLNPETENKKMYTTEEIEKAKAVPLQSIHSFQKIKKSGQRMLACCPFHNDPTPSFVIYPDNGFHCFGCQVSGQSAIDFITRLEGISFVQAVKNLLSR